MIGPTILKDAWETMQIVQNRLQIAQSKQKSYVNRRRRDLEFVVGVKEFLKLSPARSVMRFGKHGKLSLQFIGPFELLERIGNVAY